MKTAESGPSDDSQGKFLCLTICGYRKEGMHERDYRHHMTQVSAPMTKDLMVKYGIVRWVQIHNQAATKAMMSQLYDPQMANLADFDCFSQVTFKRLEDYKRFKQDPVYKQRLTGDHENFADTKRSSMTIGWVEQFIDGGVVVDGIPDPAKSTIGIQLTAVVIGAFLSGAMVASSLIGIPASLSTTPTASLMNLPLTRMYRYGHYVLPALLVIIFMLYMYIAQARASAQRSRTPWILAGLMTIAMVPFTSLIVLSSNNTPFESEAAIRADLPDIRALADAQALVARWSYLYLARSLFPLAGAALGSWATFKWLLY